MKVQVKLGTRDPGSLSTWYRKFLAGHKRKETSVPCGSCTACCRVPGMYIILRPGEEKYYGKDKTEKVGGQWRLRKDETGACLYLRDSKCTVYMHRPQGCRVFDCRLYVAAQILPEHQPVLREAILQWAPFRLPLYADKLLHVMMRLAMRAVFSPTVDPEAVIAKAFEVLPQFEPQAKHLLENQRKAK